MKLFDSELRVMNALWSRGEDTPAKELAVLLADTVGWNKNTTYTVIKKCVEKGAIQRLDPGFLCHPLISREEARRSEASQLVEKLFDGSASLLMASLLDGNQKLSPDEIRRLKALVDELE